MFIKIICLYTLSASILYVSDPFTSSPIYWFPLRVLCNNPKGKLSAPTSGMLTSTTEAIRTRWCYSRQPIRLSHISQPLAAQGAGLADVPLVATLVALDSIELPLIS